MTILQSNKQLMSTKLLPGRIAGLLATGVQIGLLALLLAGCAGPPPVPVNERSGSSYQGTPDGYYRVKSGDSLYGIAFRFGLDWREIAQWNGISSPYVIHPDQLLQVGSGATQAGKSPEISGSGVQIAAAPSPGSATRTLDTPQTSTTRDYDPDVISDAPADVASGPAATADAGSPDSTDPAATDTEATVVAAAGTPATPQGSQHPAGVSYSIPAGDPDRWLWPTEGPIISRFQANDPTRKGLDIGGQAGQKVIAAAPGQVVYSGSGLIGYGELIIIKHSDRMLSAYAHNQKRLVGEGESVAAGSSIAEMGTNDRSQAILHFEIRVNGVPTDPLSFLPLR
jgi:lipoprotein NlpD